MGDFALQAKGQVIFDSNAEQGVILQNETKLVCAGFRFSDRVHQSSGDRYQVSRNASAGCGNFDEEVSRFWREE